MDAKSWYTESDGGPTWVGHYMSHQPKTYYVVNADTEERFDCESATEARNMADRLNNESERKNVR